MKTKNYYESPTSQSREFIPIKPFALTIGWHPESLRRACRSGRVKGRKFGSEWRIPPDVADEILQNGIPPLIN